MANRCRNSDRLFFWAPKSWQMVILGPPIPQFKRLLGRKVMPNLDSILKNRDITLTAKVCLVKAMVFTRSHVWVWELDYIEGWAPKNWCFLIVMLEKTLESPFDCKEIQPVHPKGNQSWIFIGRTNAETETLILCPPDGKNWLWKRLWC